MTDLCVAGLSQAKMLVVTMGLSLRPTLVEPRRILFVLPRGHGGITLLSPSRVAANGRPEGADGRKLGLPVERITLHMRTDLCEIPMDHPGLDQGWWELEKRGGTMWRWTNGAAEIPLAERSHAALLEIRLAAVCGDAG